MSGEDYDDQVRKKEEELKKKDEDELPQFNSIKYLAEVLRDIA